MTDFTELIVAITALLTILFEIVKYFDSRH